MGHKLISEALCFGGSTCTATDIAVAAGVAPSNICQVPASVLASLNPTLVYRAMTHIREMIERGIDTVKVGVVMAGVCDIYQQTICIFSVHSKR